MKLFQNANFPPKGFRPDFPFAAAGVSAYMALIATPYLHSYATGVLLIFSVLSVVFETRDRRAGTLTLFLLIFLAAMAISIVMSRNPYWSLYLSIPFIPSLLVYALINWNATRLSHIRIVYSAICAIVAAISAYIAVCCVLEPELSATEIIKSAGIPILIVPNDILFAAVFIPFAFTLGRGALSKFPSLGYLFVPLAIVPIVALESRSGLVTALAVLLCACLLMGKRVSIWYAGLLISAAVVIDAISGFEFSAKLLNISDGRLPLWSAAVQMFLDAPVTGQGLHTFGVSLPAYAPAISKDWADGGVLGSSVFTQAPWAHNLYLELLAQTGLIGLGSFLVLVGAALRTGIRLSRSGDEAIRKCGAATTAALIGFCVAGLVELTFLRLWVVVVFFMIIALISALADAESDIPATRKPGNIDKTSPRHCKTVT